MLSTFISTFPKPLGVKIEESFHIINLAYAKFHRNIALCFNGGKDSTVLLDLIHRYHQMFKMDQYFNQKSFFFNVPNEFPEIQNYYLEAQKFYNQTITEITTPNLKDGLNDLVNQYSIRAIFLGVRRSDPEGSQLKPFDPTSQGWAQATRVFPILHWDYHDIWKYLDTLNIPVCKLYAQGYTSIGSVLSTKPNPKLYDEVTFSYKHARELQDSSFERLGRM